jgi:phosphohistidine phosphatase
MKYLYLVRHGKAESKNEKTEDQARRLVKKGKEDIKKMGVRMKKHVAKIDCLVTSPALRARKTAQMVARKLDYPEKRIVVDNRLYPGTEPSLLLQAVAGQAEAFERVIFVCHAPQLVDALKLLAGGFDDPVPPGCIVGLEIPAESWKDAGMARAAVAYYDFPESAELQKRIAVKNRKHAAGLIAAAVSASLNSLAGPPDKKTAALIRQAGVRIAESYCRNLKSLMRLRPRVEEKVE